MNTRLTLENPVVGNLNPSSGNKFVRTNFSSGIEDSGLGLKKLCLRGSGPVPLSLDIYLLLV